MSFDLSGNDGGRGIQRKWVCSRTRGHGLILAVFTVSLAGSYLSGMLLYLRYLVPLMPLAALLISRFVLEVARVALPQRYATAAATALLAVASLDPLSRAVSLDRL